MAWLIAGRLASGRFELQAPSRFALEIDGVLAQDNDTRTGEQIINELHAKLISM